MSKFDKWDIILAGESIAHLILINNTPESRFEGEKMGAYLARQELKKRVLNHIRYRASQFTVVNK